MKSKLKKFLMNPWIVSTGSGLLVLIVTVAIDYFSAERIFTTFKKMLIFIWSAILTFLNFEIKVWWLLIGIAVLLLGLYIYCKYLDSKQSVPDKPEFLKYTQDTILGYKWDWHWEKGADGNYYVDGLRPICPQCNTPLVIGRAGFGNVYTCLRCNTNTNRPLPCTEDVEMLILDNIKKMFFPNG